MTDWSSFHEEASRGRVFKCKLCDLLADPELPPDAAEGIQKALADSQVSDTAIERAFVRRGVKIGRTAVNTHRTHA